MALKVSSGAPAADPAAVRDYGQLVVALQAANSHFARRAVQAVNVSLTLRNWYFGMYIAEFELHGIDRAAYGERLLANLADVLTDRGVANASKRQLHAYCAFYRTYPELVDEEVTPRMVVEVAGDSGPAGHAPIVRTLSAQSEAQTRDLATQLSYSHFELLATLPSDDHRRFYEAEAIATPATPRQVEAP